MHKRIRDTNDRPEYYKKIYIKYKISHNLRTKHYEYYCRKKTFERLESNRKRTPPLRRLHACTSTSSILRDPKNTKTEMKKCRFCLPPGEVSSRKNSGKGDCNRTAIPARTDTFIFARWVALTCHPANFPQIFKESECQKKGFGNVKCMRATGKFSHVYHNICYRMWKAKRWRVWKKYHFRLTRLQKFS